MELEFANIFGMKFCNSIEFYTAVNNYDSGIIDLAGLARDLEECMMWAFYDSYEEYLYCYTCYLFLSAEYGFTPAPLWHE